MPYSSGTTGLPKGVLLTHRNLVANVLQTAAASRHPAGRRDARLPAVLPHLRDDGADEPLPGGGRGAGDAAALRARGGAAADRGASHAAALRGAAGGAGAGQASAGRASSTCPSLEFVLSGAAPLGAELAAACAARIGCETVQGYGMTEMSPVSHFTPPGRNRPGASGAQVAEHRMPAGRSRERRGLRAGGGGRALGARAAGDAGLPQQPGGDGGDADRGRLAEDRRSRADRRGRLHVRSSTG